ncbi:MAG: WYL domain-containing protein [Bacteroidota bacterium]|nr:WYL domain-containing protein [Bacteroidota bacterium]
MSFQSKLKRYLLILEKLRSRPTFAQLAAHLGDHDLVVSERTVQRDMEQIRIDLGLEITYDRNSNTYMLSEEDDEHERLLPLLERAVLGEMLGGDGHAIRDASPFVSMERRGTLQGLRHWARLLRAIQERKWVKLEYKRYQVDIVKEHRLRPALLKEYHGRWYVIGLGESRKDPLAFGLDRIQSLQVMAKKFAILEVDVMDAYESVIGVDRSTRDPVRVTLRFTPEQGKYVKSLPLHSSQHIVRDDAKALEVVLVVAINYELRQELLGMGDTVKVLEPASLAKEMKERHLKASKQY